MSTSVHLRSVCVFIIWGLGSKYSHLAAYLLCMLLSFSVRALHHGIAPVAQLDRASDYGSGGWEFESSRARQSKHSRNPALIFFALCGRPALSAQQFAGFDEQLKGSRDAAVSNHLRYLGNNL